MCRTRHDTDLLQYLGDYEFSVVPRPLFIPDGHLYKSPDQSVILNEIDNSTNQPQGVFLHSILFIIFDGMAIINSISIENLKNTKTCEDFANAFTIQVIVESQGFPEVRVIFDIYLWISLKFKTKNERTNMTQIQYKVDHSTIITHLKMFDFDSHIQTKQNLTVFLAKILKLL